MISTRIQELIVSGASIRAMFEDGRKMAELYGAENVYDFMVGNPGLHPPQEVFDAIREINETMDPHEVHGYPPNAGLESTRKAVAEDLNRRFGMNYGAGNIIMTVGSGTASNIAMQTLYNPGDKQIVFAPHFLEYITWAENYGAESIIVPCREENGFEPDPEDLRATLTPDVKAVIINNPNNPTGVIYSEDTIRGIADVLREAEVRFGHPIYILSDEPYRELVYTDQTVPFIPRYHKNTLIAYSWSKSLSLGGDRIGYLAVTPGADEEDLLIAGVVTANRICGVTNAPTFQQLIIERCLDARVDIPYYRKNAEDLYRIVSGAGFTVLPPQGGFYLWIKSPVPDESDFLASAREEHLLLVAGSGFAAPGYVRATFCIANETILRSEGAFRRLAKRYGL